MAQSVPHHDFRRLRLDTCTAAAASKPCSSPFASIPHDHPPDGHDEAASGSQPGQHAFASSVLSTSDLLDTISYDRSKQDIGPAPSWQEFDGGVSTDNLADTGRRRNTSISFSNHAVLDDGQLHSLDNPLPKPASSRRRTRGQSLGNANEDGPAANEDKAAEASRVCSAPKGTTGQQINGESASGPAPESDGHLASLTSASTASSGNDELDTPSEMASSFLFSPRATSSPSLASGPWPILRQDSKSRISSRVGSLRSSSRRSSRLSGSMSPASAFLSQWGRESMASIAPSPDDEGQSFGLQNEWVIGHQIGFGGFSVIKEVFGFSPSGERIRKAAKIVRKNISNASESDNDQHQTDLEREVGTWRCLNHENILALDTAFDTDFATFCVMDFAEGGSLFDLVSKRRKAGRMGLDYSLAKRFAYQLASALRYLHEDVHLVHRDVKLENCLIDLPAISPSTSPEERDYTAATLKLCDFGLADFATTDLTDSTASIAPPSPSPSSTSGPTAPAEILGTLQYAAPENLRNTKPLLQPSTDIWALGICIYALVTGDLPFKHALPHKIIELISAGVWDERLVSEAAGSEEEAEALKEVLAGCLERDPECRWTVADVLEGKWFREFYQVPGDGWEVLDKESAWTSQDGWRRQSGA